MTVEQNLCRRIADALKGLLPGIRVDGNFIGQSGTNPKGTEPYASARARVTVDPRGYPAYTAAVAEVTARVDVSFALAADPDASRTFAAYGAVSEMLEAWHVGIRAAKDALGDAVCGVRLSGGQFDDLDDERKNRTFSQTITIKTRRENT